MNTDNNLAAWFNDMPVGVRQATDHLMQDVERMRESQVVYPAQDDILNALSYTAPQDVRVVILGQDPYHGPNQAMGLSFSVPEGEKLPPSLRNIYKEMAADLGCKVGTCGDLTSWAEQGVLLLNTTLTVCEHAANSHSKLGWQVLTDYLVKRCFQLPQPIVFFAWGRHAITLIARAREEVMRIGSGASAVNKLVIESTHPSPLSANKKGGEFEPFMGSRPFSRANGFLEQNGSAGITWESVVG